jgi:hypothetical protein
MKQLNSYVVTEKCNIWDKDLQSYWIQGSGFLLVLFNFFFFKAVLEIELGASSYLLGRRSTSPSFAWLFTNVREDW